MPTDLTPPEVALREQVMSWQSFYRQCLRAVGGNEALATLGLIDLMISSGLSDAAAGTLAMAVRMVQESPEPQHSVDAVQLEAAPGHPEFEEALGQMRTDLGTMVEHGAAHFEWGHTASENTACTYQILLKSLPREEMAGFLAGAITELAKLGWRP